MKTNTMPDKNKTESLLKMADITLQRLHETDIEKYPTNTLLDYYDILHKIMEAITSKEGVKFSGEGAHYELIEYICTKHNINPDFTQQLRDYRNRISYEGFMIKASYIKQNRERIEQIIDQLTRISNQQ